MHLSGHGKDLVSIRKYSPSLNNTGGLSLPYIRTYYHAVHLSRLIDWCRHREMKLWTQIEQDQSAIPLQRAPWCHLTLPMSIKRHPLIGNTTNICSHLISQSSSPSRSSPLFPIIGNPQFEPGLHDMTFQGLAEAGHFQTSHFSSQGRWKTISQLTDPTGPFCLDFSEHYSFTIF